MTVTTLFWLFMALWLALGALPNLKSGAKGVSVALLPWACALILGWRVLGAPIQ